MSTNTSWTVIIDYECQTSNPADKGLVNTGATSLISILLLHKCSDWREA